MKQKFCIEIKEISFFNRIKNRLFIFLMIVGIIILFISASSKSLVSILSFIGFSLLPLFIVIIIPYRQHINKVEIDENGFTLYGTILNKKFIEYSNFENFNIYLEDVSRKNRLLFYRIVFKINNKSFLIERHNGWTFAQMVSIMEKINEQKEKSNFLIDGIFEMKHLKELAEFEKTDEFEQTYRFII